MPINHQYHTWICRIRELRPGQRITQVRNFVWLLVGIQQSRSVTLSKIAGKIPGEAKLLSTVRDLPHIVVPHPKIDSLVDFGGQVIRHTTPFCYHRDSHRYANQRDQR